MRYPVTPCCSDGRCRKCADRLRAHVTRLEDSLMAVLKSKTKGASRCPDCGSTRFDAGGAAALHLGEAHGFALGVEAAARRIEQDEVVCNGPLPESTKVLVDGVQMCLRSLAAEVRALATPPHPRRAAQVPDAAREADARADYNAKVGAPATEDEVTARTDCGCGRRHVCGRAPASDVKGGGK